MKGSEKEKEVKKVPIWVLGAGGHALACLDVLESGKKHRILGLVGFPGEVGKKVAGYPVLATDRDLPTLIKQCRNVLVAVGQIKSPLSRQRLFNQARFLGAQFPLICSPWARVSSRADLGEGTVVMPGAVVQPWAVVGKNCILNSQCLVEHGAKIGDHCHISTGAILNGDVTLGSGSFVGSGAVVQEGVRLAQNTVVPMGKVCRRRL